MVGGGFHFDGQRAITPLNRTEIDETVKKIRESNIKNVVISGLFSPVNNQQEIQVKGRNSNILQIRVTQFLSSGGRVGSRIVPGSELNVVVLDWSNRSASAREFGHLEREPQTTCR